MSQASADPSEPSPAVRGPLAPLDAWVAANPWHARILPFVAYIAFLFVIEQARGLSLYLYPVLYALQCAAVAYLLWRYRRYTPELTLRFHWLAIPTGLFLCWAWIELGELSMWAWPSRLAPTPEEAAEPHYFQTMLAASPALGWTALVLRVLGMSLLVPCFEELFTRSAMLRGLHRAKPTAIGLIQVLQDMPLIGDAIAETKVGQKAAALPPMFTKQLVETPLGHLTVFGVTASTLIFMLNHGMRDWLGCIACGVVWCVMLWWTNREGVGGRVSGVGSGSGTTPSATNPTPQPLNPTPSRRSRALGLGPIIWSHGITNAALWAYCVYTGDWQWM